MDGYNLASSDSGSDPDTNSNQGGNRAQKACSVWKGFVNRQGMCLLIYTYVLGDLCELDFPLPFWAG